MGQCPGRVNRESLGRHPRRTRAS
ncbi:hypothetical protein F383_31144 [Gossypium arboreum]|uniref:Uncharacterized protein n=1 Tax=Gossypium arboreum TaxID=29729 RepID=A0A0B0PGX0_GOSAR|nr:hypothetical protein F383_06639 [Gossypium arboreum]KHG24200.1 hypothetical protein F383_31144 [Gossypium arboreum]